MRKRTNYKMVNALAETIMADEAICRQMIHRLSVYNPATLVSLCETVVKDYRMGVETPSTSTLTYHFEKIFKAYDGTDMTVNEKFVYDRIVQGLNKINCIKDFRAFSGAGLKEAKEFVEGFAAKCGLPLKTDM